MLSYVNYSSNMQVCYIMHSSCDIVRSKYTFPFIPRTTAHVFIKTEDMLMWNK